jgi:hypothetical protein
MSNEYAAAFPLFSKPNNFSARSQQAVSATFSHYSAQSRMVKTFPDFKKVVQKLIKFI